MADKKVKDAYILDRFSEADLRAYNNKAELLDDYERATFYCYEEQRVKNFDEIKDALLSTRKPELTITNWKRVVDYIYSETPLSTKGSVSDIGGRFNYGRTINPISFNEFNALYLAIDKDTAWCEKFGLSKNEQRGGLTALDFALTREGSLTILDISGKVENVFDLREINNLKGLMQILAKFEPTKRVKELARKLKINPNPTIRTSKQLFQSLLEENWRRRPRQVSIPSNSQIFGKLICDCGFEGIIYPSTKTKKDCLALFPNNFTSSNSFVEIKDAPKNFKCTRLDSKTYKELF